MMTKFPASSQKIITVSGVLKLFQTVLVREKVLTQRQRAARHRKPCRHGVVDYKAKDAMDSQRASLTRKGAFTEPGLAGACSEDDSFPSAHL